MSYFTDLIKETSLSFTRLFDTFMDIGISCIWPIAVITFIVTLSIVLACRLVVIMLHNQDTRLCTASFWMVISICTFGLAGIICWLLESSENNHVKGRNYHSWPFLLIPTSVCLIYLYCSSNGIIDSQMDISKSLFLAFVSVFAEIFIIFISPLNKRINVLLPDSYEEIQEYIKIIQSSSFFRKKALSHNNSVTCSMKDKNIVMKLCTEKYLSKYLLIDEHNGEVLIRTYKKPSGEFFKVLELESYIPAKISDCFAGLFLMILISTPYISMCVNFVNDLL